MATSQTAVSHIALSHIALSHITLSHIALSHITLSHIAMSRTALAMQDLRHAQGHSGLAGARLAREAQVQAGFGGGTQQRAVGLVRPVTFDNHAGGQALEGLDAGLRDADVLQPGRLQRL